MSAADIDRIIAEVRWELFANHVLRALAARRSRHEGSK